MKKFDRTDLVIWLIILNVSCVLGYIVGCENEKPEAPNDVIMIDPNLPKIDKAIVIQFTFPDANIDSIDEAASALRKMDTRKAKEKIDFEVTIGDETHAASFEDFFEWMGFKR